MLRGEQFVYFLKRNAICLFSVNKNSQAFHYCVYSVGFIFDSINMKILYFQIYVETFNVKVSIIVRLDVDLEYWLLLSVNK